MLDWILPRPLDNTYRGHPAALWLFALVVLARTGVALGIIFNGRVAAQSADGIPLDSYGAGAAQAVVTLFAILGLAQLVISVFGVLALTRYRAMIPFMFVLLLIEHLARRWILLVKPIARIGAHPGGVLNLALIALMIVGLVLSLWSGREERRGAQRLRAGGEA
jgi:hypothetical protein